MSEDSASAIPSSIWASMSSWFTPTVLFVFLNVMIGTIALTSTLANQKKHHNQQQVNDPNQPKIARSPSVLQRLKSINFYTNFRSHQELQNPAIHHKPIADSESLFNFENAHQEQIRETQSGYFFQTTHQENFKQSLETAAESQAHYIFEQTHEEIPLEMKSHLDFGGKETNLDAFQKGHEENEAFEGGELQSMDEVYSQLTGSHFSRTKSDTEPSSGAIRARLPTRMKKFASLKSPFRHFEAEEMVEARRPATVRERGNAKLNDDDEEVDAKADDFINRFKQQLKLQRLDSIIRSGTRA